MQNWKLNKISEISGIGRSELTIEEAKALVDSVSKDSNDGWEVAAEHEPDGDSVKKEFRINVGRGRYTITRHVGAIDSENAYEILDCENSMSFSFSKVAIRVCRFKSVLTLYGKYGSIEFVVPKYEYGASEEVSEGE